jgi:hypothetical protein
MSAQLVPVAPDRRNATFAGLRAAFEARTSGQTSSLVVGIAYATRGGVDALIKNLRTVSAWSVVRKRIVVGVHQGITEPAAFELLGSIPNSEVRAYIPGGSLSAGALVKAPIFHPKFMALTDASFENIEYIQVGSANLSVGASGNRPRNFELAIAMETGGLLSARSRRECATWWSGVWTSSKNVDAKFVTAYAQLRLQVIDRNPIIRQMAEAPVGIQNARNFFVEVGAASGPPGLRHQVEFPRALTAFFGRPSRAKRLLTLAKQGTPWRNRPLTYKKTTYNVEIWRLGMPTQASGGVPIAERAVMFRRTDDPDIFDFDVVDLGDTKFARWNQEANLRGHIGSTQGSRPRSYGFY